ncbi:PE domain-containing protein [Mycolicibacterium gadium]|uniref:PE domain-containing protein n=1 Tax=Mycolicibacterium gadium TaxID=1794 RepID=A0ABT6GQ74_MYCGU|nr:PE domain-containing protein [Mycolicibacterium gadium]MDG5483201.1 PE domain-containing protein [Mycolicibacterium gadium]
MTEDLRVDTALVRQSGGKLETIAGLLPEPPASFSPSGADALSTAIAGRVSEVVDPVLAQMPIAKDELTRFAQNVMEAADSYDAADRRIAEEILKQLGILDEAAGGGGSGSGAPTSAGSGAAGAPAAGAAQSDQMGQLMQMPMQLAQQAAQIPMQLAGMAAAIPQAMMQGVQTAVQQATQMAQSGEGDEKVPEDEALTPEEAREERDDEEKPGPPSEVASGTSVGERVPDAGSQEPTPPAPAAPKPAPTRPAESGPEIAL